MNIGLYGGTFDPVHNAHVELAYTALKHANLTQIIFVPAGIPPHKKGKVFASSEHRYNMLRLATQHEPKFQVSRFEMDRNTPSFTINTVDYFLSCYPGCKIYLIVGLDTLIDIPNWYHADELIKKIHTFLVAKRPHFSTEKVLPEVLTKTVWLPFEPRNIASHEIRELIQKNKPISHLVPPEVEKYIYDHKLYRNPE